MITNIVLCFHKHYLSTINIVNGDKKILRHDDIDTVLASKVVFDLCVLCL